MKERNSKILAGLIATAGLAMFSEPSQAQTLGDIANAIVQGTLGGVNNLITGGAYLMGVAFGVKAALKLKEHNESEGRTKLSTPLTLGVVSALLLGLPTFLKSGVETTLGSGATMGSLTGARIQ